MGSTGRFRSDLIAAAGVSRDPVLPPGVIPTPPGAANPYVNWLDRVQRLRGRHAAITKNLYTWSNYKHWADKVKDQWDVKKDPNDKTR